MEVRGSEERDRELMGEAKEISHRLLRVLRSTFFFSTVRAKKLNRR
jgi:hypothetical protein